MQVNDFLEKFYEGERSFEGIELSGQNLEGLRLTELNSPVRILRGQFWKALFWKEQT